MTVSVGLVGVVEVFRRVSKRQKQKREEEGKREEKSAAQIRFSRVCVATASGFRFASRTKKRREEYFPPFWVVNGREKGGENSSSLFFHIFLFDVPHSFTSYSEQDERFEKKKKEVTRSWMREQNRLALLLWKVQPGRTLWR